jgi:hypothetical protein
MPVTPGVGEASALLQGLAEQEHAQLLGAEPARPAHVERCGSLPGEVREVAAQRGGIDEQVGSIRLAGTSLPPRRAGNRVARPAGMNAQRTGPQPGRLPAAACMAGIRSGRPSRTGSRAG